MSIERIMASTGVLTYRRMVKKKDLVKIFFIYMCLYQMVPAHPCGDNPLRSVIGLSEQTGQRLPFILRKLKQMDYQVFGRLQESFQRYAECVGMVDTGYFKRSERQVLAKINPFTRLNNEADRVNDYREENRDVNDIYRKEGSDRDERLQATARILSKDILPMLLNGKRR